MAQSEAVLGTDPVRGDECRFLDDGMWFIEGNTNFSRTGADDRPNGFLMVRCEPSLTTPSGCTVGGTYEKQLDGRWRADVLSDWDEDTDSDCKVLGAFATRNEAILALWDGRDLAIPQTRQPLTPDVAVSAAWREAFALAADKGEAVFGSMSEGKEFGGKVLGANAYFVVQNLGRGSVIHDVRGLDRVPRVNESVIVKYDANGRGAVTPRERTGQERMRGGR